MNSIGLPGKSCAYLEKIMEWNHFKLHAYVLQKGCVLLQVVVFKIMLLCLNIMLCSMFEPESQLQRRMKEISMQIFHSIHVPYRS
jgi:hypothetical protein